MEYPQKRKMFCAKEKGLSQMRNSTGRDGLSRGNLRLLGILGGVVAVLAICALLLLTFGSQQPEESSVSSVSEESSQVGPSEVELPDSLLDE